MIDITSVQEMREELISALVKYLGGIVSFATLYNGLQTILDGRAFAISNPSSVPYFDLLYYSVVTISTVGYGDVAPASLVSKAFVMAEILFGIGFALLLFAMLVSVYIDIMRRKGH
jgi:Ion channel